MFISPFIWADVRKPHYSTDQRSKKSVTKANISFTIKLSHWASSKHLQNSSSSVCHPCLWSIFQPCWNSRNSARVFVDGKNRSAFWMTELELLFKQPRLWLKIINDTAGGILGIFGEFQVVGSRFSPPHESDRKQRVTCSTRVFFSSRRSWKTLNVTHKLQDHSVLWQTVSHKQRYFRHSVQGCYLLLMIACLKAKPCAGVNSLHPTTLQHLPESTEVRKDTAAPWKLFLGICAAVP